MNIIILAMNMLAKILITVNNRFLILIMKKFRFKQILTFFLEIFCIIILIIQKIITVLKRYFIF
jgi:hypothetical protein